MAKKKEITCPCPVYRFKKYCVHSEAGKAMVILPKVGEICLFHDESLQQNVKYSDDCSKMIAEFYKYEDGKFVTPDNYGFKYCTRLGDTL